MSQALFIQCQKTVYLGYFFLENNVMSVIDNHRTRKICGWNDAKQLKLLNIKFQKCQKIKNAI